MRTGLTPSLQRLSQPLPLAPSFRGCPSLSDIHHPPAFFFFLSFLSFFQSFFSVLGRFFFFFSILLLLRFPHPSSSSSSSAAASAETVPRFVVMGTTMTTPGCAARRPGSVPIDGGHWGCARAGLVPSGAQLVRPAWVWGTCYMTPAMPAAPLGSTTDWRCTRTWISLTLLVFVWLHPSSHTKISSQ